MNIPNGQGGRVSVTRSVSIGRYGLEVAAYGPSLAQFSSTRTRADKAEARKNAGALHAALSEPDGRSGSLTPIEWIEELEASADAVTARVERANRLFKAAAEDRPFDRGVLTAEVGALLGLLEKLDREGRYEEEIRVAKALHGLCVLAFRWLDLVRSLRAALAVARMAGDEAGQAWALNELGALHLCAGDPKKAKELLERALGVQARVGDAAGRCAGRHNLDNARRDAARPVQIGVPRRLIAFGCVVGALAFFGAGGAVLGVILGIGGDAAAAKVPTVTLTVEIGREGGGSVLGDGIDCGADCTAEFADGKTVILTAVAGSGSDFRRWDGVACEEGLREETCTLRVNDDLTAIALFEAQPPVWTLSVATEGTAGSVLGDGIDCGADCTAEFADGKTVILTAVAGSGSDFYRWEGVLCTQGSQYQPVCTFTLEADVQVVSRFLNEDE
jgi:tetratricopeptide (TPR) repeat protein